MAAIYYVSVKGMDREERERLMDRMARHEATLRNDWLAASVDYVPVYEHVACESQLNRSEFENAFGIPVLFDRPIPTGHV